MDEIAEYEDSLEKIEKTVYVDENYQGTFEEDIPIAITNHHINPDLSIDYTVEWKKRVAGMTPKPNQFQTEKIKDKQLII